MSGFDVQGFLAVLRGVDHSALATPHDGLNYAPAEIAGVPAEWTVPDGVATDPEAAVMYIHGGGYVAGTPEACRLATSRIALGLGVRVIAPDYRLAPEHPFPAAHEDVLAVYRELITAQGVRPEKFAVAGDSAGGSMAVSLIADAREAGLPMPACGMLNSPFSDAALNSPSLDDPDRNQHSIPRGLVDALTAAFLSTGGVHPKDPRHSPIYRDLCGLTPLLIQVAGHDICHDDGIRLAAKAREAGVNVTLTEYPNSEHIFIVWGSKLYVDGAIVDAALDPEPPRRAAQEMVEFARRHLATLVEPATVVPG
jgi:epsilon-lactone hydrolase